MNNTPTQKQVLWTRKQTAAVLGMCTHSVMNLEKRGLLPAVRFGKRFVRYRPQDVNRLIDEMSTGGRS